MPSLSAAMEQATILQWLVADGEYVEAGNDLLELEIDKATMTYPAEVSGTVHRMAQEGDTLAVGARIAFILAPGEAPPGGHLNGSPPAPPAGSTLSAGGLTQAPEPGDHASGAGVFRASPLARRIAREQGLDLASITGSGSGGRIVRADVEATLAARNATGTRRVSPAVSAEPIAASVDDGRGVPRTVELSRVQRTAASRMADAHATIPEFTVTVEIDMALAVDLRGQLKSLGVDPVPTYNDMVVKACAIALREFPRVNASYRDGALELYSRVNIGVAVAAEGELFVPTVFDADQRSATQIAAVTRALAEKVRSGTVTSSEMQSGTFTVSNLGMFGASHFTAMINPPQAAILAVGALTDRVVVRDGQLGPRPFMFATLTCDHRVLNGAEAALFAARVRELLERPVALLT